MRRNCIVLLGTMAVLAGTAALAWACTPQSYVDLSPTSGRSGDTVTVTGRGFIAGPVEIHWNGGNGPLLTTATGPNFAVKVTIPATGAGTYYVSGIARTGDGAIIGNATRALQVRAAPAASRAPTSSAPATSKPRAKAPSRTQANGGTQVRHGQPAVSKRTSSHGVGVGRRSNQRAAEGASGRSPARAPISPAAVRAKSGQTVFADSLPPAPSQASTPGKADTSLGGWHPYTRWHIPSLVGGPAAVRTTTGGLGSGFGEATHPAGKTTADGSGPKLGIGAGFLGLGLVLLFGGFAVAEARRRRVPADGSATRDREDREADRLRA